MPMLIPAGLIAFAGTTVGGFIISTAISLTVSAVVARINRKSGPKPQDIQSTVASGSADRAQHFGRVRTSGALMYADWATVGGDRRAFVLLAASTGGITSVDQWFLDGRPVAVNSEGWVQTAPWKNRVRLRVRTGRGAEFAGGDWADLRAAFPMRWTAAHRLDGVATFLGEFDAVAPEQVADTYPGGRPPEISAVVRGAACWEPATGNFSFTDNPIRHLLHYLCAEGDGSIPADEFDLGIWDAARLACNDGVPTAGGTRPRYVAGGSYFLSEPRKDVAGRILDAVGGNLYLTAEGKIGVRVARYSAVDALADAVDPVVITADKIVSMDFGPGKSQLDRVTTLVPEYTEPSLDYTETTADPWEDPRAIARFGEPKPREFSLPFVQHHGQARHLARIAAARENPAITASLSLRFWGLLLIGRERVPLHRPDRGLTNLPMRITGLSLDLGASDGVVKVQLESNDLASLGVSAALDGTRATAPNRSSSGRPLILAPVITGVSVADRVIRGTVSPVVGYSIRVQFRATGDADWAALEVNQATGYFRTPPLSDGQTYAVRARWIIGGLASIIGGIAPALLADQTRYGPWTEVTGIVVVANSTPPAQPVLVSAGRAGDTITIVFQPDLGANYYQTGIWRGATFGSATLLRWVRDQSSTITVQLTDAPAPATYWLRSGNGSGIASAPLNIGTL
ncbi:MAG: hypothetical protein ACK41U_12275 [Paracoccus sp. (in: a-proteobacteria)]|uniref:hypothetical protein n=1 Tax=Paracoccus sp. TaxID=267 RepID=UPI00391C0752